MSRIANDGGPQLSDFLSFYPVEKALQGWVFFKFFQAIEFLSELHFCATFMNATMACAAKQNALV